jgi:hypothetical protein
MEKPKVYIGEAENVFQRLVSHIKEKEFWNESVVFISKDENLNKAHIKYLESTLYEIAILTDRYEILNGNKPPKPSISEPDQAEMEEFIENIKMLISTLGFKVFEPIIKIEEDSTKKESFYIKAARGADAKGKRVSDGFVVLKGSEIAKKPSKSFPTRTNSIRNELIEKEIIIEKENHFFLTTDYLFSSPSTAAAIVMGRSANGLLEWKDKSGNTLKLIETNEIK